MKIYYQVFYLAAFLLSGYTILAQQTIISGVEEDSDCILLSGLNNSSEGICGGTHTDFNRN